MMMRMLEKGGVPVLTDKLRQADEDNPLGYFEFEPVKRLDKDTSWLGEATNKAVKIIYIFASSGKSVGDGERQRAVALRNRRSLLQVESNDRC